MIGKPTPLADPGAKATRPRGRPREFDRQQALEAAMHTFWQRGFDKTSMVDLVETMGIASPSIYAAFGSKENLFREALSLYVETFGVIMRSALHDERDLRTSLRRAFREVVALLTSFDAPRGCLVALGVGPLSGNDVARRLVSDERHRLRDELHARFTRAVTEEGFDSADIDAAVEATMAFYNGLSVELLDLIDVERLLRSIDLFVKRLVPGHPGDSG